MLQPYFLPEKDGAVMTGDSKAGKMEMHLKDGYVAQLDYNELKKKQCQYRCFACQKASVI